MSLQTRINAIERQAGVSVGCPECGYYKGALMKFEIVTEPEESARLEDRRCATCRRQLIFTFDLAGANEHE
jgi:hypothetical protein